MNTFKSISSLTKYGTLRLKATTRNMVKVWRHVEFLQSTVGQEYLIQGSQYNGLTIIRIR